MPNGRADSRKLLRTLVHNLLIYEPTLNALWRGIGYTHTIRLFDKGYLTSPGYFAWRNESWIPRWSDLSPHTLLFGNAISTDPSLLMQPEYTEIFSFNVKGKAMWVPLPLMKYVGRLRLTGCIPNIFQWENMPLWTKWLINLLDLQLGHKFIWFGESLQTAFHSGLS